MSDTKNETPEERPQPPEPTPEQPPEPTPEQEPEPTPEQEPEPTPEPVPRHVEPEEPWPRELSKN